MKLSSLIKKLEKMNISYSLNSINELNKEIVFEINNLKFECDYNYNQEIIESFSHAYGYCESQQETMRMFFKNFNSILKFTKI